MNEKLIVKRLRKRIQSDSVSGKLQLRRLPKTASKAIYSLSLKIPVVGKITRKLKDLIVHLSEGHVYQVEDELIDIQPDLTDDQREIFLRLKKNIVSTIKNDSSTLPILESEDGITYCAPNMSEKYLLGIDNNEEFIVNAYFKLLNRPPSRSTIKRRSIEANSKRGRDKIIKSILESNECKSKGVSVVWTE